MPRTLSIVTGVSLALLAALPGRASLSQPDEPALAIPVRPDGVGEPLPFDQFKLQLVRLMNQLNPELTDAAGKYHNPDREQVLARVEGKRRAKNLPPAELAALAADMLRLGNSDRRPGGTGGFFVDQAINLLKPRTRDRVPNYFVFTTLAQLHAARGNEWAEALTTHQAALLDAEMPAEVKGLTKAQRDWQGKLDSDYVLHYYALHKREAEARPRPAPENEEPPPLFPVPERDRPHQPVRFVNDAGQYEPGVLAAAERAKLPPDAVAVVQQMLFWFPTDARLYWLLGELYAADGKLDEAKKVLDECADSRKYGNRRLLMEHRAAVHAAVEARQRADEEAQKQAYPISLRTVVIYFGAVVALAIVAAVRVLARRARGHCGPSG